VVTAENVTVTYELKRIRCGKARCRCARTDDRDSWHGPYWYAFWTDPKNGKTRCRYVGKKFTPPHRAPGAYSESTAPPPPPKAKAPPPPPPRGERRHQAPPPPPPPPPPRGERHRPQLTPDEADAEILGVSSKTTAAELKRAWRKLITAAHPDRYQGRARERQEELAKSINAAYQRMLRRRGWTR
jgi:hypothetical protein